MAKKCLVELVSRRHACAKSEAWNDDVTGLIVSIPNGQSCDLSLPLAENILKKKACLFVFDWPHDNVCSPFKSYVNFLNHNFNATLLGNQTFIYCSSRHLTPTNLLEAVVPYFKYSGLKKRVTYSFILWLVTWVYSASIRFLLWIHNLSLFSVYQILVDKFIIAGGSLCYLL